MKNSSWLILTVLLAFCSCAASEQPLVRRIGMDAAALYQGYAAVNVRLDRQAGKIVLDPRKIRQESAGWIETDVLDPFDPQNSLIGPQERPGRIEIACAADIPETARVELWTRCGDRYFSDQGWTAWQMADSLRTSLSSPPGKYLKIRLRLVSPSPELSPALTGLKIEAFYPPQPPDSDRRLEITAFDNRKIVASPVDFGYERADQPVIRNFFQKNDLPSVVAACTTELDTLAALTTWVGMQRNTRNGTFDRRDYPWNLDEIVSYDSQGKPSIEGHCMSYAVVLISSLTGFGFHARHWADQGFRFADHEVVEAWSNSYGKWIYLDPSLAHYYRDKNTKVPMSILDLHRVFVNTFFRDGENLRLDMDLQRERVKQIGGKNVPLEYVSGDYSYGKPNPDYDWGWFHGYLAAGFMRLTTRNDFHSRKEPWFTHFGQGVHNYDWFLSWSDDKTPVSSRITAFSDRERDFWWTLDQASIKASRTGKQTVGLEFGQSQPFFKSFMVSVDGSPLARSPGLFDWSLHLGQNTLTVLPLDEWGRQGTASTLSVLLR